MAFLDPELCFAEEVPSKPPPGSPGTSLAMGKGSSRKPTLSLLLPRLPGFLAQTWELGLSG